MHEDMVVVCVGHQCRYLDPADGNCIWGYDNCRTEVVPMPCVGGFVGRREVHFNKKATAYHAICNMHAGRVGKCSNG